MGRRDIIKADDKAFVAEIARTFHVEKAVQKATKIEKKNSATSGARQGAEVTAAKKKKKSQKAGGSVWITFKGGFSGVPIMSSTTASKSEKAVAEGAACRGNLTEKAIVTGVRHAQEYMESAKEQAAEAGLHYTGETAAHCKKASAVQAANGDANEDGIDYTEGDKYLKEQHSIAVKSLEKLGKSPIGTYLAALIGTSGPTGPTGTAYSTSVPSFADKAAREAYEDALVGQKLLLGSEATTDTDAARAGYYFQLAQYEDSQMPAGAGAKGNTVCIVRSKASCSARASQEARKEKGTQRKRSREDRGKKATIAFRTKSRAEAFVQNFMNNVIRKEMSGAMRIRDGHAITPSAAAAPAEAKPAAQQQPNQQQSSKGGKKSRR